MRIAVVSWSTTRFDSRVRRCVRTLATAGHDVTLVAPDAPSDLGVEFRHGSVPSYGSSRPEMMLNAALMAPARVFPFAAISLHRTHPCHRATMQALSEADPEVIFANDWMTLPSAVAMSRRNRSRIIYDTHEMATAEHATSRMWRLIFMHHVRAVESRLIGTADRVVTIGQGLADAISALYPDLVRGVAVVRNLPEEAPSLAPSMDGTGRRLVYAGLIRPERNIAVMVQALARLDSRYTLTIIGFGSPAHIADIRKLAGGLGVESRIFWREAVAPDQLVQTLSVYDIGLFLSEDFVSQQRFALPNKIFEYTAAGLAIVASGSEDVTALLAAHGNGISLHEMDVEHIVGTLAAIDDSSLLRLRAASRTASQVLSWESEKQKLFALLET